VGANVTAFSTLCSTSRPLPDSCPVVNWTTTNATGGFGMELSAGDYYIAVHPDTSLSGAAYPYGFGGTSRPVDLSSTAYVALTVYPLVPYGNATLVLPGYVCDAQYLNDVGNAGPGCQNPVLSWTQDGAYYVNATSELVFYSFVNRTVYPIAPWTLLYQRFPDYPMIPGELFITQDGSYLYGWGTLTSGSDQITAEAVNVTTHRVSTYTFSGFTTTAVTSNGQVQLTGWHGNDSDLTLILANGSIYKHDLWSTGQTDVGRLDFFEANNIYWEPYLNGYVNVQAEGSSSDQVEEWQLEGPTGYTLTRTFDAHWGSGRVINGVNGVVLNLTDRTLSFGLGGSNGANVVVADLNDTGAITGFASVLEGGSESQVPGPVAASDRPTLLASGPALGEDYNGFYNASWLVQLTPGHFGFETTNLTGLFSYAGAAGGYEWAQWSQEGQFYNTSYLIAPNSYACTREFVDACTVNGTGGVAVGTIWWYWQLGDPEFPFTSTAPAADVTALPPTSATISKVTSTEVALNWTLTGVNGTVYYSVDSGTTPAEGDVTWLPGDADSYNLTGLTSGARVYASVAGWNLHYGATGGPTVSVVTGGPAPPSGIAVTANNTSAMRWSWTQSPSGGIVNNTLYVFAGIDCSGVPEAVSTGGAATEETVGGLSAAHRYSAYVTAWNASGQSSPSACAAGSTRAAGPEVTFSESGLPGSDAWYVNITPGVSLLSSGADPTMEVSLANGTYDLQVATNDKTFAPSFPSQFTVDGAPVTVSITFSLYRVLVVFGERGLPPGTPWSVTVGTEELVSNTSTLEFNETNGTYAYAVSGISGWHQSSIPYAGSVVVAGVTVSDALNFTRVTYEVAFDETGLTQGTGWSVLVNQSWARSTGPSIVVNLPNGSSSFRLGGVSGYRGSPSNGTVTVNGTNLTEPVSFTRLSTSITLELVAGAAVALALATATVVLLVRRRRRKASGTSPRAPEDPPR